MQAPGLHCTAVVHTAGVGDSCWHHHCIPLGHQLLFLQLQQLLSLWLQVLLSSSGGLSHRHRARLPLPPLQLSGPFPVSELSGYESLLPCLVPAGSSLLSHSLLGLAASSNSSHSHPASWNTAAKLSSQCSALTHRHSGPHCSPAGVPASSDLCAGSRAF